MTELLVLAIALVAVFIFLKTKSDTPTRGLPTFYGKKPMTAIEQTLYFRLTDALPDHIVLAQVQLSQVVGIKRGPHWQTWFNKISRKSLDFVVCRRDASVVSAIELDDNSHDNPDRARKDADKDAALRGAGLRITRWTVKDLPSIETIQKEFDVPQHDNAAGRWR